VRGGCIQKEVELREGKGEQGWVAQMEIVMTKAVAGASFEIKQLNPAWTEVEVVDESGECGESPSKEA
jgi:hypothetical protein